MRSIFTPLTFSLTLLLAAAPLYADPVEDAKTLTDEATAILKASAAKVATPEEYATSIVKLEKAQGLLEGAGQSDSLQAQEVNAALFWARKFSNVQVIALLQKMRAAEGVRPIIPRQAAPAAGKNDGDNPLPEVKGLVAAKAAYDEAEKFAGARADNDYAVALRWFQVADQFSGTEYALKALLHAREAQGRMAQKNENEISDETNAESEMVKTETPEFKLVREADDLASGSQLEEAIEKYKSSIKTKDSIPAERRLGHAYFKRAEQRQEELLPKFEAIGPEYNSAFQNAYKTLPGTTWKTFDDHSPEWTAVQLKLANLRKDGESVLKYYIAAQQCFENVLKLSPDKKDFDAAAYKGVSMARRPDSKFLARTYLPQFLKDYTPSSGEDRFTYEYCKSELHRLGGR